MFLGNTDVPFVRLIPFLHWRPDTRRRHGAVAVREALDTVADAHGAEPATAALAWLLTRPTVVAPIASARDLEQLPALLAVQDLTLTDEDIRLLTKASA